MTDGDSVVDSEGTVDAVETDSSVNPVVSSPELSVDVVMRIVDVSRLSCDPGAVGATVLNKDEDVPVKTEVEGEHV